MDTSCRHRAARLYACAHVQVGCLCSWSYSCRRRTESGRLACQQDPYVVLQNEKPRQCSVTTFLHANSSSSQLNRLRKAMLQLKKRSPKVLKGNTKLVLGYQAITSLNLSTNSKSFVLLSLHGFLNGISDRFLSPFSYSKIDQSF